jgi:mRNA-degrading endonuclease RelE of RelBE toxin-antitoxin system
MKITIEPQPREFIGRQPPATRKRLREMLHAVEKNELQPGPLDDELDGFYKLKIEGYRLIVQHVASDDGSFYRVVFAEKRSVVYELFKQTLGWE